MHETNSAETSESTRDCRPSSRRTFLGTLGWAAALGTFTAKRPVAAADPVKRNGKSHIKLSLAAYSFRQELMGQTEKKMTLEDFVRLCADLNLDACELTSYYFPKDFDDSYLLNLKQLTFRLGLDISGTAIANDFCLPPGPKRDEALAHTRKWVDHAATLGAPVIRIFAGNVPKGDTEDAAIMRCAQGINEAVEYAAKKGVILALEDHHGITSTADQMLKIIGQVNESPYFGVNFDTGNFQSEDPYVDMAKIAPYAVTVQVKPEIFVSGGPKTTPADLPRIFQILRDANYRGYVALEYEGEHPETVVPQLIEKLRPLARS